MRGSIRSAVRLALRNGGCLERPVIEMHTDEALWRRLAKFDVLVSDLFHRWTFGAFLQRDCHARVILSRFLVLI